MIDHGFISKTGYDIYCNRICEPIYHTSWELSLVCSTVILVITDLGIFKNMTNICRSNFCIVSNENKKNGDIQS